MLSIFYAVLRGRFWFAGGGDKGNQRDVHEEVFSAPTSAHLADGFEEGKRFDAPTVPPISR
jgi:hypothetical protein